MFILYYVLAFNFDNKSIHCDLKTNKSLTDVIQYNTSMVGIHD